MGVNDFIGGLYNKFAFFVQFNAKQNVIFRVGINAKGHNHHIRAERTVIASVDKFSIRRKGLRFRNIKYFVRA
jgi:hypothetical protein